MAPVFSSIVRWLNKLSFLSLPVSLLALGFVFIKEDGGEDFKNEVTLPVDAFNIPVLGEEAGLNATQGIEVMGMVDAYIMNSPAKILRSLENHRRAAQVFGDAIGERPLEYQNDAATPEDFNNFRRSDLGQVINLYGKGAPDIVIGVDYNCPYCMAITPRIQKLAMQYPDLTIAIRPVAILDRTSQPAARFALAVAAQGQEKFVRYHYTLMNRQGALTDDMIVSAAVAAGVDASKMPYQPDQIAAIDAIVDQNEALLHKISFSVPVLVSRAQNLFRDFSYEELEVIAQSLR